MATFIQSVRFEDNILFILDQTKLPTLKEFLEIDNIKDAWDAIKELKVRGAPAIGIAAAYGLLLGIHDGPEDSFEAFYDAFTKHKEYLASSRPTAVNLFWALNRMEQRALADQNLPVAEIKQRLVTEAHAIRDEDEETCRMIGEHALTLFEDGMGVLTHCNAGGIATARYGTALAPIYLAKEKGWDIRVFADETRPLLQGARLTAWELQEAGIDVTLITDSMAAMVMSKGWVQAVIVGCDRVAANGDVANKIGTYGVALLAKAHGIPFYVAAPMSTIDLNTATGEQIPIEEREAGEIIEGFGKQTAPNDVKVFNPAFDVTPHDLITAIITEKGILRAPYDNALTELFQVTAKSN
ncbi:S-methyl-5-thioribose-1-phosphate isomerase [Brevibacillus halotolerans]|uniref:S-methyl-5-thioribose-1-phosphate isomerase n=1 Tax=Brevibacillus TaxID=55080 RepID=UPI00215BAF34|nr:MULTISPECIES: S-methyl-5-thioribose-1-phosphate isomerase [Brevibacillus]MCR8964675.1 S-methyl-5-thioribose-1-phosphate isomerase [Brevibacillus laterosporus]MCZ0836830.1 S-methyl-5-thioribose-1-phosphate isomerase [Brevibacillus halotolerans]